MMTKTICAVIPARQGSKGLINKNIKLLNGHPLIAYSIALAKLTPSITRVIVSTDSPEYADIAKKYGAEVPFLRPADISTDKSTDLDFFAHLINWFSTNEKNVPEAFVHLRPTTPLRDPEIVSKALNIFLNNSEVTSLRSGHISPESPFKWFKKNANGYFTNLEGDLNIDSSNRARQEFPDVYIPDGYVDVINTSFVMKQNKLHGDKVIAFESPNCVEIDSIEEFEYIEYLIQKNGSPLKTYLDGLK